MITEHEQEWLERREILCTRCGIKECVMPKNGNRVRGNCDWFEIRSDGSNTGRLYEDYRDAAEFDARVQKWLMYQYEKAFQCKEVSGGFMPSRETMLMFARLAVEEEMESSK